MGDLSLEAQAKLLRFLEEGEFYRVGGTKMLRIQTRVVSATNKNLDLMIGQGLFRNDLYFRLGVIKVQIPSLNERPEDIIPLAKHFLHEFSNKFDKAFTGITPEAQDALMSYRWTGNVRELRNLIERGVLTGQGPELKPRDLGIEEIMSGEASKQKEAHMGFPPLPAAGIDISSVQESLERFYIKEALKIAGGNESKAARLLNLNHHTFRYRRKRLNIA